MKKERKHPFWENAAKDRLTVRLNITHDDVTIDGDNHLIYIDSDELNNGLITEKKLI